MGRSLGGRFRTVVGANHRGTHSRPAPYVMCFRGSGAPPAITSASLPDFASRALITSYRIRILASTLWPLPRLSSHSALPLAPHIACGSQAHLNATHRRTRDGEHPQRNIKTASVRYNEQSGGGPEAHAGLRRNGGADGSLEHPLARFVRDVEEHAL